MPVIVDPLGMKKSVKNPLGTQKAMQKDFENK